MSKPLKFTRQSVLRLTDEQWQAVEEERRRTDKIPAFAELVRELVQEALHTRRMGRETFN